MGPYCQRAKLYVEETRKKLGFLYKLMYSIFEFFSTWEHLFHNQIHFVATKSRAAKAEMCHRRGVSEGNVCVGHALMCVLCRKVIECMQNLSSWKWIRTLDSFSCCNLAFSGLKLPEKLPHPWFPKPSLTPWDTRTDLQRTRRAVTVLQALKES